MTSLGRLFFSGKEAEISGAWQGIGDPAPLAGEAEKAWGPEEAGKVAWEDLIGRGLEGIWEEETQLPPEYCGYLCSVVSTGVPIVPWEAEMGQGGGSPCQACSRTH